MCTPECNYMQLAWCYVEAGCQSHFNRLTNVETLRPHNGAWSYEFCGSANCWSLSQTPTGETISFNNATHCPEGPGCDHYRHCECLFEGMTLPKHISTIVGNPLYGTHCEIAWDLLPGTTSYTEQPECMEGERYADKEKDPGTCSKECNWHYKHWCYVEIGVLQRFPRISAREISKSHVSHGYWSQLCNVWQ